MEKFSSEDLIRDIVEWVDGQDEDIGAVCKRDLKDNGVEGIQKLILRVLAMLTMDVDSLNQELLESS